MSIPNDIIGSANVSYLGDPFEQYCGLNGKPLIGGHIEVYLAGTSDKYMTLQDFDGDYNPFKVPLGADGRVVMLADPSLTYDIYVYNSYNDLVCSRLNVECTCPGTINLSGADTWVRNTDGTLDISLRTSANNRRVFDVNTRNKLLDVQSPLYFVENSETATVIGFSGDDFASKEYVDSAVSSKLDTTAFSNVSGDFLTDKFEYDDDNHITAYNHSAFAGGGGSGPDYEAGDHIAITDNVISVTGLPTSSDVENAISSAVTNVENKFEYNENNYITAYNNSAFAGTNYSAGDYVSIENDTISVTGLQPSGDYATHDDLTAYQPSGDYATKTELESATSGKMDVTGMTAYQPTGDYATHDDLTAYQPVGDYYSASNPSGFITNDAITGLQPSGDYVTHDEMTAYQPTGDYATHDDLTGYATTALVSSVSSELYSAISGISGDFELVAGSGVELVDDPNAKTTTINVTAEGTPVTAIEQMIESATSGISAAISGSYTLVAGNGIQLTDDDNARTTTVSVSGDYATTADLTAKQDTLDYGYHDAAISSIDSSALYDASAHARINTLAGRISNLSSDKLDASAFSEVSGDFYTTANPSGFITDEALTSYQTIEGMTAYQPVGSYLTADALDNVSGNWNEVSAKADTSALDNYLPLSGGSIISNGSTIKNAVINIGLFLMSGNQQVGQYSLDRLENDSISANSTGIYSPHLTADSIRFVYSAEGPGIYTVNRGFNTGTYAFCQSSNSWNFGIGGPSAAFYASGPLGITDISTQNRYLGQNMPSITVSSDYGALKLNLNGGEYIVNPTSNNSAVKWRIGESTYLWNGQGDSNYNMPLLLAAMSKTQQWSNAPFISANYDHIELTKGTSGPRAIVDAQYYSGGYSGANVYYYIGMNGIGCSGNSMDVQVYVPNQTATYSLRNSIQKTDIDGDTATSAITAIAGSAIGGVPQSAFDELKQSYDALSALFAQYSGHWLLPNEGEE